MPKPPEPEPAANHERWLVSFADFMTLLFALFVVLFANSQSEDGPTVAQISHSITRAFGSFGIFYSGTGTSAIDIPQTGPGEPQVEMIEVPVPPPLVEPNSEEPPYYDFTTTGGGGLSDSDTDLFNELEKSLQDEIKSKQIEVRSDARGVVVALGEAGFFDSGSAELKAGSIQMLDRILRQLDQHPNREKMSIAVEGHTDDVPISRKTARIQDNRDLSYFRAKSVLNHITQNFSFPDKNLSLSALGEYHPVDPTPDGRARNRRVDLVIHN